MITHKFLKYQTYHRIKYVFLHSLRIMSVADVLFVLEQRRKLRASEKNIYILLILLIYNCYPSIMSLIILLLGAILQI